MTKHEPSFLEMQSPHEWGLPAKFDSWRPGQANLVQDILDCETRFQGRLGPAGTGKSPAYVLASILGGGRTCILTSNKGLQTQLMKDFQEIGLVDIRGKGNYQCNERPGMSCEDCWSVCRSRETDDCPYRHAYKEACKSPLVVTNYTCWLTRNQAAAGKATAFTAATDDSEALPFDRLILDEAHEAVEELSKFIAVDLSTDDIGIHIRCALPSYTWPMSEWKQWAETHLPYIKARVSEMESAMKKQMHFDDADLRLFSKLTRIQTKLQTLAGCRPDMWVVEPNRYGYKFDPVWPGFYASNLFRNIKSVILVSATLREKTLQLLGLDEGQYTFSEYPSPFNPNDAAIYYVPTARIWHGSSDEDLSKLYNRIDESIGDRLDRKGLIHSVSYPRALEIVQSSRYRRYMHAHIQRELHSHHGRQNETTAELVQRFKNEKPPYYLVSPSVSTGYDFPGPDCEVNIIPKLRVPDQRSSLMKERLKRDPEYGLYLTVQDLVQACGRGNRYIGDRCQTLIFDDSIKRYIWRLRHLFPKYFFDFFRTATTLPKPQPLMQPAQPARAKLK